MTIIVTTIAIIRIIYLLHIEIGFNSIPLSALVPSIALLILPPILKSLCSCSQYYLFSFLLTSETKDFSLSHAGVDSSPADKRLRGVFLQMS